MRISDWSSDVCSSDLQSIEAACSTDKYVNGPAAYNRCLNNQLVALERQGGRPDLSRLSTTERNSIEAACSTDKYVNRSEEHTSELQSLMRISYAVFCLKKKKHNKQINKTHIDTSK